MMNNHFGISEVRPATGLDISPRDDRITPMNPSRSTIPKLLDRTVHISDLLDVRLGRYRGQSEQLNMYDSGPDATIAAPAKNAPTVPACDRGCPGPALKFAPRIVKKTPPPSTRVSMMANPRWPQPIVASPSPAPTADRKNTTTRAMIFPAVAPLC